VASNYTFTYIPGRVTVNPATVTITASSPSVLYGSAVPVITPIYGAFQNGDSSSVLTTPPVCVTAYTTTSNAGSSPSTTCSGAAAANYSFSYVNGAVTVGQATAAVNLGSLAQTYTGSPLAATATTTPTGLTVNLTYNGSPTAPTAAGNYAVVGTINDTNYQGSATGTLVISKVTLTVTANSTSMIAGAAVPALTASYSGFVNGETPAVLSGAPALSTTATSSSPGGNYPITVSQGALAAANYSFAFVGGTLSVLAPPTIVITTSATISGSHASGYTEIITVKNTGTGPANNVTLTSAMLGGIAGAPLNQNLGTIPAAGGTGSFTVTFPGTAGADGKGVAESYGGTYTGGTFSTSIRSVTLP
jgi:hypothetical protein